MDRTNYTEQYRTLAKKYGGNVVSSVNSALKKLDAERNPGKIASLTEPAKKALQQAITDLKPMLMDSKFGGKAHAFTKDLTALEELIKKRHQAAMTDAKETAADDKEDAAAEKTSADLTKALTPLDEQLLKQMHLCSSRQKDVWTAIEKFSEKRWKCIYAFAKAHGGTANGFRGFPFAINMMVEEVGSKEMGEKGLKGSVQTLGLDHKEEGGGAETNKVKSQFVNYSKGEVRSEMAALVKELDELDNTYADTEKCTDKISELAGKIHKSVKNAKVASEIAKLHGAITQLNDKLDKAGKAIAQLTKKVQKDGGLGEEDAEFRDAYQEIPSISVDGVHKALQAVKAAL